MAESAPHVVGCVLRYNKKLGYGFISVLTPGQFEGQEIFVHSSGIAKNTKYPDRFRMLYIGECVEFDVTPTNKEDKPNQATNVGGYKGNTLMCDNSSIQFRPPQQNQNGGGFRVTQKFGDGGNRRPREKKD